MNHIRGKYRRHIVYAFLAIVLIAALVLTIVNISARGFNGHRTFDSSEWKVSDKYERGAMVWDLLNSPRSEPLISLSGPAISPVGTRLDGLTEKQVIQLLGPAWINTTYTSGTIEIIYEINEPNDRYQLMGIPPRLLTIYISPVANVVESIYVSG